VETIQVSIAHAYPGTEMYDFAKKNGFIVGTERMVDDGGHQSRRSNIRVFPAST